MAKRRKPLPSFLRHVSVPQGLVVTLNKQLRNWLVTQKYIQAHDANLVLIERLLVLELTADEPREGMLEKLIPRYNTARKNQVAVEMEKQFNQPHVIRICKTKQEKEKVGL